MINLVELRLKQNLLDELNNIRNLSKLSLLDLNYNQIQDASVLGYLLELKFLYLSNNSIKNIDFLSNLTQLIALDLSFNSAKTNYSYNHMYNLDHVLVNTNTINAFINFKNKRLDIYNKHFLDAVFIITTDDLSFLNCSLTLDFIKRNIHLNLFYNEQISNFLINCKNLDLIIF